MSDHAKLTADAEKFLQVMALVGAAADLLRERLDELDRSQRRLHGLPEQRPQRSTTWSHERCRLHAQLTADGVGAAAMLAQLNALPGAPLTRKAVQNRKFNMARNRAKSAPPAMPGAKPLDRPSSAAVAPPRAEPLAIPPVAAKAAPVPVKLAAVTKPALPAPAAAQPARTPALAPVVADIDQIRAYAASRGIEFDSVDKINSYCLRIGAPRFTLCQRVKQAQVLAWAAANKCADASLDAVNATRKNRGLPIFVVLP